MEGKPTPITDVWEVRLPPRLWAQICAHARKRRKTFSTITRLCVFALAERSGLRWRRKLKELHEQNRAECSRAERLHRHMVCLYGEDVRLVRLAALELGVTVSAFIRLALRFYLRYFAMEKHSPRYPTDNLLFWRGIKRWAQIQQHARNHLTLPATRRYLYLSFPPTAWW
ncbi:MAG: hypothetical protein OHK0011_17150 [Turneriella sp.]